MVLQAVGGKEMTIGKVQWNGFKKTLIDKKVLASQKHTNSEELWGCFKEREENDHENAA